MFSISAIGYNSKIGNLRFERVVQKIPSPIIRLYHNLVANVRGTRDMERLDGVPRERVSSRYCVKQAMDGLFVAKQLLYRVLNNH